jgi:hypothetical protein
MSQSWSARLYAEQDSVLLAFLDEAQAALDDLLSGFDASRTTPNVFASVPPTLAAAEANLVASTVLNVPAPVGALASATASVPVASESSSESQSGTVDGDSDGIDLAGGGSNAAPSGGRRVKLPMRATLLLQEFFRLNISHPYPTEDEKQQVRASMVEMDDNRRKHSHQYDLHANFAVCIFRTARHHHGTDEPPGRPFHDEYAEAIVASMAAGR